MGCSVAKARTYCEEGSIGAKVGISTGAGISAKVGIGTGVGIGARVGIGASPGKDIFGPFWMPLLASSIVYSGGVGKWALLC